MGLFNFLTQEIAIDLGTANTLIIMNDKVVVDEPSIVAKDIQTGKVVAIGKKAQQMHGKTHKLIETFQRRFFYKSIKIKKAALRLLPLNIL